MAKFYYSTCKKSGRENVWNKKIRGILNMRYLNTSIFRIQITSKIVLTGGRYFHISYIKTSRNSSFAQRSEGHLLKSDITKVAELKFL